MMRFRFLPFALLLAVTAVTGCSKPVPAKSSASAGSSAEPTPGQRLDKTIEQGKASASDAALTAKVKTALASDVGLKTLKIDVDANAGVITLKGQVDNDDMKQRAQKAAQSVQGVTWVQNQLSVAPRAS